MRRSPLGILALAAVMATGCYSGKTDSGISGSAGGDAGQDGDGDGDGDGDDDDDDGNGVDEGENPEEVPAPNTRFYRLTHAQWENTVRDLFGLADITGFSSEFRPDAEESGYIYANNAQATEVDEALWAGYQRAANDVAEMVVVLQPALMDNILSTPGDADAFVREFGRRVFRRPLTDEEAQVYIDAFADAPDYYTDTTGFEAGVRLTIESMLQSPHFVYRIESSEEEVAGVIPLSNFEVASRLSYFLWDSMPDDELLDVAEAGMLEDRDDVAEQAARMLDTDKAHSAVLQFHDALHDTKHFADADPNEAVYPNAPEDIGLLAQEEHEAFVRDVIFEQSGSYIDMLTSTEAFVNQDTAPLYGLDAAGFGPEFTKTALDPTQRKGMFTQLGFLISNATGVQPDPIHRGVFLASRIACADIPAPPDDIPELPVVDGQTNREAIEDMTEQEGSVCAGCHAAVINPWGYPFENYDSTGAWRTEDNGFPVNAASEVVVGGEEVPVANAVDLMDVMAGAYEVHACYAENWVQFANGRPTAVEDLPLVQRLAALSMEESTVKESLIELATSRPFRTRAVEEVD